MSITSQDIDVVESLVDSHAKKPMTAYALWLFLGWFGAHRFYAGRTNSGFAMTALCLSVVGFPIAFFWWMADAFVLGSILSEERELLYDKEARLLLEDRAG